MVGDTLEQIQDAAAGDEESCGTFKRVVEKVRDFALEILEHPFLDKIRNGLKAPNDVVADIVAMFVMAKIGSITIGRRARGSALI